MECKSQHGFTYCDLDNPMFAFIGTTSYSLQCAHGERREEAHKTFQILKMKAHFEKEPHFENEDRN